MNFAVPADHRIKLKEGEKKDKYLDLARELKNKLWSMKVTIIPIVIGAFSTVTKGLLKGLEDLEIRGQAEIIQTTTLLRTARDFGETFFHSDSSERPSAHPDVKNSLGVNNNNNNDNNNDDLKGSTKAWKGDWKNFKSERIETILTTVLLKLARILRGVLDTCCHSDSSERQSTNADVKSS